MLLLPTLWLYINLDQDLRRQAPVEDDIESQRDPRRSLQRGKKHIIYIRRVCVYMFELGSFSLSAYRAQLSASSTLVFFNGFCANRIEFTAYLPCVCVYPEWILVNVVALDVYIPSY